MKKFFLLGLSALALIACEDSSEVYSQASSAESFADFAPSAALQLQRKRAQPEDGAGNTAQAPQSFLAYRYGYGLVMPAAAVKPTTDKHIQLCRNAGPAKCQITGSNTNSFSDENISATLALRAEPNWLIGFVDEIKADVAEVDGKVQTETTSAEDLTRAILDTDARLKAKRILQKRLENLIETRDAELPDLLALEREIARVHGEIESATANLKALRARVSMSIVNINYTSERLAVSRSSVSPIGAAFKDFISILSQTTAGVIRFAAVLLPLMLFVILPGFFGFRWLWRRRKVWPTLAPETSEEKSKTAK